MVLSVPIRRAARILKSGGVAAYPTEGVFGLGCMPGDAGAVFRILSMKKRSPDAGLILIASSSDQLNDWIDLADTRGLRSSPDRPITWIVPPGRAVPRWVLGKHRGLAVRISTHPVAAALCEAARSPLVSTSANVSGTPPARNAYVLRRQFGHLVDCIVPGRCGPAAGPSEIRDFLSGEIVRRGAA